MTSVRLEGVTVRYGEVLVLDGVDVDIEDGELFFLLGPSGCGKTTLLRTVAGFIEPDKGRVCFGDSEVTNVPPAKRDCGMVFQNYALWPHLTVLQNVSFGLDVRKVARDEKDRRAREALSMVKMSEFADRPPNQLSGGQQQRVALARALVVNPSVLLLDEPLSNLDAALRIELRAEIRDIQKRTKRTALYVTHDRAEALALADRVAILKDGRVEQVGSPIELYELPTSAFVASFVGEVNRLQGNVVDQGADHVLVRGPFGVVKARSTGGELTGENAIVLLRPEKLVLSEDPGEESPEHLHGQVVSRTFLGELAQHDVKLKSGETVRVLSLGGSERYAEGAPVRIRIEDAMAFSEDD